MDVRIILSILLPLLAIALCWQWLHWRADANGKQGVVVGDLWEAVGDEVKGLCEVLRPNVHPDAKPDSWVMRRCFDGRILYMHHDDRVVGRWQLRMRGD